MKIIGAIPGGGGGSSITLKTNGVLNGSQVLLNLVQSGIITLTDDGAGNITINAPAPVYPVTSVAGKTGAVVLVEGDITNLVADLAAKAPLASPAFTGTPTAPTQPTADNSSDIATTAFVHSVVSGAGGFQLISKTVLGAAQYFITLAPPSSGFNNLRVIINGRTDTASGSGVTDIWMQLNGDTAGNYYTQQVGSQFGGTSYNRNQNATGNPIVGTLTGNAVAHANAPGLFIVDIIDYLGVWNKVCLSYCAYWQDGSNAQTVYMMNYLWTNTIAAINAIKFGCVDATAHFKANTVVCLYGY